jgi:hypothetical protein
MMEMLTDSKKVSKQEDGVKNALIKYLKDFRLDDNQSNLLVSWLEKGHIIDGQQSLMALDKK